MKFKNYLLLLLFIFCVSTAYTQDMAKANQEENCPAGWDNGWCWGTDPETAKVKNVLYSDALNAKEYDRAVDPLEWLLENTPNLNKSIYINGEKLYKALEKSAEGDDKIKWQDKLLALYDTRIQYFGDAALVNEKKGKKLYPFMIKRAEAKEKYAEYLAFYEKMHTAAGNKSNRINLIYQFDLVYRLAKQKKLTEEEIIVKYEAVSDIFGYHIANDSESKKAKWVDAQKRIDGQFEKVVNITCEYIREKWSGTLKNDPSDIKLAKKATRYMLKNKCTDDPLFYTAVENVHKLEPSIQMANILAQRYLKLEEYDKAKGFLNQVIELAEDSPSDQADAYISLAKLSQKEKKYVDARSLYMKAAEKDVNKAGKAYGAIGDMYMVSRNSCLAKSDPNPVKDRAVYFAAYAMYQKAGSNSGMSKAAAQFPSMPEIFQYGYKVGDIVKVECWVGGSYAIKKRP